MIPETLPRRDACSRNPFIQYRCLSLLNAQDHLLVRILIRSTRKIDSHGALNLRS